MALCRTVADFPPYISRFLFLRLPLNNLFVVRAGITYARGNVPLLDSPPLPFEESLTTVRAALDCANIFILITVISSSPTNPSICS